MLDKQFDEDHIQAIGVQEGRCRVAQLLSAPHYDIIAGAADTCGTCGCQLWLHRSLKAKQRVVRNVSPRIMLVEADITCGDGGVRVVRFIVAHAPQRGS